MFLIQIYNICWIFESLLLIYLLIIAFDKLIINLLYLILLLISYNNPYINIVYGKLYIKYNVWLCDFQFRIMGLIKILIKSIIRSKIHIRIKIILIKFIYLIMGRIL